MDIAEAILCWETAGFKVQENKDYKPEDTGGIIPGSDFETHYDVSKKGTPTKTHSESKMISTAELLWS